MMVFFPTATWTSASSAAHKAPLDEHIRSKRSVIYFSFQSDGGVVSLGHEEPHYNDMSHQASKNQSDGRRLHPNKPSEPVVGRVTLKGTPSLNGELQLHLLLLTAASGRAMNPACPCAVLLPPGEVSGSTLGHAASVYTEHTRHENAVLERGVGRAGLAAGVGRWRPAFEALASPPGGELEVEERTRGEEERTRGP
ncbi:unnamed protein product [Arctogadus glacialis]